MLQYQAVSARKQRQISLATFETTLSKWHTDPEIATTILQALNNWRNETNTPYTRDNLLTAQSTLGWDGFVEGRLAAEW
jgi:hypothetical protein